MSDLMARGQAIADAVEQRKADGLNPSVLSRVAGMSRQTYYQAVKGEGTERVFKALEDSITDWDEHPDDRDPHPEAVVITEASNLIEIEMNGVFGVDRVTVRGPVENPAAIREAAMGILDDIRSRGLEPDQATP